MISAGRGRAAALSRLALDQWRAVYLVIAVLVAVGAIVVTRLPEQVYPPLAFSRVMILAENGDLAPSIVQAEISRPLEQRVQSVIGVTQVTAESRQGISAVFATFDPKVADASTALQRISSTISSIQSSLPAGTTLSVQQVDPDLSPAYSFGLSSNRLDSTSLREMAKYQLRPTLVGLPGVAIVNVLAGSRPEFLVSVDPVRLASRGITLGLLTSAIAKTNAILAVGHSDAQDVRSTVLASGQAHSADDLAAIPIAVQGGSPVTVGMVANVRDVAGPELWSGSVNGHDAVIVNVLAQRGANIVDVSRIVANATQQLVHQTPGLVVQPFWNQATLVSSAIANLRDAILIGLVLATLVLFFFLRSWSSTIITAAVIPITIFVTFAIMDALGQTLNLMTLGGLAVGVGLVIDDAIVVVENVYRHLGQGEHRRSAILQAISEIAAPMASSTFTTIVVFAPLAFVSGVPGAFFTALAITLSVALIVSLVLAMVVTPTVAAQFLRLTDARKENVSQDVQERYEPLLRRALGERRIVVVGAATILLLTVLIGMHLSTNFLPALDEGAFEMHFLSPPGTTLAKSTQIARDIEGIVRRDPAVASEATLVGLSLTPLDISSGVSGGVLRATLVPKRGRAPISIVMQRIQDRIHAQHPDVQTWGSEVLADMLNDLSNTAAPIEVRVFGPDQSVLVPLAGTVARRIARVPGVSSAFSGVYLHDPTLVLRALPGDGAFNVTPEDLMQAEQVAVGGDVVSTILRNPVLVPVRVRYDFPLNPSLQDIESIPIVTGNGSVLPLSRLASFQQGLPQSDINEINGRQYIDVTAQLSGGNLGAVISGIKAELAAVTLPPGYSLQIAGAYALQNASFREFALAIAASVALVFLIMLVQFRSALQPLAIALCVPLALFGAFLALWATGMSLNISSLMGVILMVGLVVKNGILLLEWAHRRQESGESVVEALVHAGKVRLRPILMTTLAALLGMLPLAFAIGSGSELLQPLAIAILGGLTFSTIFTLIVIPVVYALLVEGAERIARWRTANV